jgi:hypothetical protein
LPRSPPPVRHRAADAGARLAPVTISDYSYQRAVSPLAQAIGRDFEGKVSPVLYVAGILLAFIDPRIACATYLLVALLWLVPDRRMKE